MFATNLHHAPPAQNGVALAGWNVHTPPTWLAAAVAPENIRAALLRHTPEFASGQLRLQHCEVKRLRLRDESGCWSGAYLLTVEGPTPGTRQIVPVQGTLTPPERYAPSATNGATAFGAAGWHCPLPELYLELRAQSPDTELATLPQLTEAEPARALLESSIRRGSPAYHDLQIQSCAPRVMRYKPGSRCTVLYHLTYPADQVQPHWPAIVVAKTYKGGKGENAYTAMRLLWESPLGHSTIVAVAEPLAYVPELNLLVQGPIRQEQTLKELMRQALRSEDDTIWAVLQFYLRQTAQGLAELHQCGVRYGEAVAWADELKEIYERRAKLAIPLPQLADLAAPLLARLEALAAQHPADPLAPAHRSFRPAQVLLHQGEIGFIDFDGFCQAEPAMDVALFMTTIKNIALNKASSATDEEDEDDELLDATTRLTRLQRAEALCSLFLQEYRQHALISPTRVMLWETLDLLSLILGSWTKLKLARLDNCLFMLERHIAQQGLA